MRVLLAKVVMERTLFLAQLRLPAAAEVAVVRVVQPAVVPVVAAAAIPTPRDRSGLVTLQARHPYRVITEGCIAVLSRVEVAALGRRVILTGLGTVGTAQPPLSQEHPLPMQAVVEVQQKVLLSRAVMGAAELVHGMARLHRPLPELPAPAAVQAVHLIPSPLIPKLAAQASSSSVTQLGHSMPPAVRLRPVARTRFTRLLRLDHLPYR